MAIPKSTQSTAWLKLKEGCSRLPKFKSCELQINQESWNSKVAKKKAFRSSKELNLLLQSPAQMIMEGASQTLSLIWLQSEMIGSSRVKTMKMDQSAA